MTSAFELVDACNPHDPKPKQARGHPFVVMVRRRSRAEGSTAIRRTRVMLFDGLSSGDSLAGVPASVESLLVLVPAFSRL